ncbi:SemiSWEET family sugar transporter [Flavobacteriaceae bacterium LMO-SS05]
MVFSIEIIGLVAAVLTTSAYIPQVYKTKKTKAVENLSFSMYLTMFVGVVLWLIYGIYLQSLALILANSVTAGLTLMLLNYKIRYSKK